MKDNEARNHLDNVGLNLDLAEDTKTSMREFVLSVIYNNDADMTCGQARAQTWHKMKRKTMSRLPPDEDSLSLYMERTNYLYYCQMHYNLTEHPSHIGHGWQILNGKCRPVGHTIQALPRMLVANADSDDVSASDSDTASEYGDSTDSGED